MILKIPLSPIVKAMAKGDQKYLKNHKTFGTFSVKKDLPYIDDGDEYHFLDIIQPVLGHDNGITLFYIHGGAYLYGTKDISRIFTSWYANQGFTVIAINYRLTSVENHIGIKEQISDVFAALKFIEDNKHEFDVKMNKFCLMGDSAGGHFSLLTDIIYHSKEAQEYFDIKELPNIDIKCLALNSTMYDFEALLPMARKYLTKRNCKKVLSEHCFDNEYMKKNSPRYYVKNGVKLHPLFNSTAYHDMFIDQSLLLKNDGKKYGLDLEFLLETSPRKEIGHVYNHFVFEDEGLKCNEAMVKFFKHHCDVE
ncbi:MAG: alpha/beta hydrolase [Bacilli bacterium]|nr:alpha/beta hydrolase [Bacilli bacterium]